LVRSCDLDGRDAIAPSLLLWLTWQWPADHTVLLISAVFLWIIIIVFSVIVPYQSMIG